MIFIGLRQIETSGNQAAQNVKLLYVGMTQAKERLLITASGRNEFTDKLLAEGKREGSPKDLRKQNAENVLFVPVRGTAD